MSGESPGVLSGSEGRNADFWRVVLAPRHLGAPGSSYIRASSQGSNDRGERRRVNLLGLVRLVHRLPSLHYFQRTGL